MEQMDSTVIATSLPAIAADLGTSPVALKLAVTSYLVALAVFIPISGRMSDRFGAKNIFRLAIVVFVLGSVACAFAGSIHAFVLARFVQGVGGSMMTPVGRLLLVRATPKHELVSAMAWLTIPALLGPIVGPPLGGFLTTYLSWHWVFWINVPIGILGLVLVTRFLDAGGPHEPRPIDLVGFVLTGVAFSSLVFGMSVHQPAGSARRLGLRHLRARDRLRPRLPAARAARALAAPRPEDAALSAVPRRDHRRLALPRRDRAIPFLLPLMLQLGFGLNPFQSGLVTFVAAVGALSSKFVAQVVFRSFGFRNVLAAGALLSSGFIAVNAAFTPATPSSSSWGSCSSGACCARSASPA